MVEQAAAVAGQGHFRARLAGAWDLVVNEPDRLYQLCDAAGDNVDTQQVNDLSATESALLTSMADQMRALLLTPDVFQ